MRGTRSSRSMLMVIAGVVVLVVSLFGGIAQAGPGDVACQGPAADHNPNCQDGELITPVCSGPAAEHNPFCADDGNGPPPENPPCDGPGGGNAKKCEEDDGGDNGGAEPAGCPPAGPVTDIVVQVADGFEGGGGPAEAADLLRAVACGVFDATGL